MIEAVNVKRRRISLEPIGESDKFTITELGFNREGKLVQRVFVTRTDEPKPFSVITKKELPPPFDRVNITLDDRLNGVGWFSTPSDISSDDELIALLKTKESSHTIRSQQDVMELGV